MKTCNTCQHWHRGEVDPKNIGAPVNGECIIGPPMVCFVAVPTVTGVAIQKMSGYPQLPPNFLACHQYEERGEVS